MAQEEERISMTEKGGKRRGVCKKVQLALLITIR